MTRQKCPHCGAMLIRVFDKDSGRQTGWICLGVGCKKRLPLDLKGK